MATYVLVHRGGHGGWCYAKVAPLLRAEGHHVLTPTLTGLGERSHLLMATAREAGRLWSIDTGHDLMITEPRAVADALLEVAAAPL